MKKTQAEQQIVPRALVQQQQREMELLSLQHEIRDKTSHIQLLQSKYDQLELNFKQIIKNHKTLLSHLEEIKRELEEVRFLLDFQIKFTNSEGTREVAQPHQQDSNT